MSGLNSNLWFRRYTGSPLIAFISTLPEEKNFVTDDIPHPVDEEFVLSE